MAAQATFRVGELVVHPAYGFCQIAGVKRAHGRDGLGDCYVFWMGSARNPIKVLVPVTQAEEAGIRRPITRQEANAILEVFRMAATPLEPRTKEQLDDVSTRLNSADLLQVAGTIRDLVAAGVKGWSRASDGAFVNQRRSEQAMLTQALARLTEELAYVQHTSRAAIEGQIRKCLGRTRRKRAPQVVHS